MFRFLSRDHALNTADSLRATAEQEQARAERDTRAGDVFGAYIAAGNARVARALSRQADDAAELLRPRPRGRARRG